MNSIETHANYDPDDLAYLRAKGYTETEIRAIWDRDARRGKGACRWEHPIAKTKLHDILNRD